MTNELAAIERKKAFMRDLVSVCQKHRVMLEIGEDLEDVIDWDGVRFQEGKGVGGYSFCVGLDAVESEVRLSVWDLIHGEKEG